MKEDPQKVSSPEQKATDQKILRQVAVTTSKAKWDDLGMTMGQISETRDALASKGDGPVKDREPEKDPVLLRPILALLTLAAIVSGCIAVFLRRGRQNGLAAMGGASGVRRPAWPVRLP